MIDADFDSCRDADDCVIISDPHVTSSVLADLASYCRRTQVRALGVRFSNLDADKVAALLEGGLPDLISLDLQGNQIDDDGVCVIAQAELPGLEELGLASNLVRGPGLGALARSPVRLTLEVIVLAFNQLVPADLAVLGSFAKLSELHLRAAGAIGLETIDAWSAGGLFERLVHLDIRETHLTEACLAALRGHLDHLETLCLDANDLGDEGMAGLLRSITTTELRALSLAENHVGAATIEVLASSAAFANVDDLDAGFEELPDRYLHRLIDSSSLHPDLRERLAELANSR